MNHSPRPFLFTMGGALCAALSCVAPVPQAAGAAPGSAASLGRSHAEAPAEAPTAPPPAAVTPPAAPAAPGAPPNLAGTGFRDCGPAGLIDDGEDGNNQNIVGTDRGGYWYTFRDKKGTIVEPAAGEDGGTFSMSEGGHVSKFAARYHGKIGTGAPLFAGMGMNFVDPKDGYDSTKYAGLAFWARRSETSTPKVRLKLPDGNTDPEGGVCTECFNDFGADLNLTTDWKLYVFPWASMKQMPGWGNPRKPHVVPAKVYGVQFQVNVPSAKYDIFVDDLRFICK